MKYGVKMSDIAKEFSVSVVTVSNALGDRGGVSPELCAAIKAKAVELGYRPSVARRPRQKQETGDKPARRFLTVGILTAERFCGDKGTFYWELTQRVTRLLKRSTNVLCESVSMRQEKNCLPPELVTSHKVNALIMLGQIGHDYLDMILQVGLPVVFLDFYDEHYHVDSIVSDSYYGGYLLTDYLISMGHRRIGFMGNVTETSSIHDRFMGYIKALMEHGIPYRKDWTLADREPNGPLITDLVFPPDMPTAFVCNCDETAFRVISALKESGYRVPEDVSVVGYDNYMVSDMCVPSITTVEVNLEIMAQATVDIIFKKLEHPDYSEGKRIIPGKLIIKNSVRRLQEHEREKVESQTGVD